MLDRQFLSASKSASIVRLCSDIIIKPNGQISVLEIGDFPTSEFTGHDRNKPEKTKRQEALEDLKEYARKINLPILFLGSSDLIKDEHVEVAREEAGLVDAADKTSEVYFSHLDDLIKKINSLPGKEFNPSDLSSYKCIVMLLTQVTASFADIIMRGMPKYAISELRKLPNIILVDDSVGNVPRLVFNGKISTNVLLNEKFKPKTLVVPRVYHEQLADEIIAHFSPAKKILIKPSFSARGTGIIAVSLEDRVALDKELQFLLTRDLLSSNITEARARMQCDTVVSPQYYWYEHNLTVEPLFILQEFIESKPVVIEQDAYQAVTRVVFTYIQNNGENIFLIHGNPYLKIAAENMKSNNLRAALISKVHDNVGPQPTILTDKTEVSAINQQIISCFTEFFSEALKHDDLRGFIQNALVSKERSTQIYALMNIIKFGDISTEVADKIKLILLENPEYLPHFFEILKKQTAINNEQSILYKLTSELIAMYPSISVKAMMTTDGLVNNFILLLEKIFLPQFETLWQNSSSEFKLYLLFLLLNGTLIGSHPDLPQSSCHKVTSDDWNITINKKLRELAFSDDAKVAFPVLSWIVHTAFSEACYNKEYLEDALVKAPFHRDLQEIYMDYHNQANSQTSTYRYISFLARGRKSVMGYDKKEYLLEIPEIVEQGNAIIADFRKGFNVNSEIEENFNIFWYIKSFLQKHYDIDANRILQNPHALKLSLITQWMQLSVSLGRKENEIVWRYKCSVFEYLGKNFIDTQAIIDAAWNLALDFLIKTEENDGLVNEHAEGYFHRVLIPNKLILSDTNKIKNYRQIKPYMETWYKNECPDNSVLKTILGVLEEVEKNSLLKVSNIRATWFGRSRIAASTNPASGLTNSDVERGASCNLS